MKPLEEHLDKHLESSTTKGGNKMRKITLAAAALSIAAAGTIGALAATTHHGRAPVAHVVTVAQPANISVPTTAATLPAPALPPTSAPVAAPAAPQPTAPPTTVVVVHHAPAATVPAARPSTPAPKPAPVTTTTIAPTVNGQPAPTASTDSVWVVYPDSACGQVNRHDATQDGLQQISAADCQNGFDPSYAYQHPTPGPGLPADWDPNKCTEEPTNTACTAGNGR